MTSGRLLKIPIIPVAMLEWGVYPFAGFLNIPIVPFVEWYINSLSWGKTPAFIDVPEGPKLPELYVPQKSEISFSGAVLILAPQAEVQYFDQL